MKKEENSDYDDYLFWANLVALKIILFKIDFQFGTKVSQLCSAECRNFSSNGVKIVTYIE